tara:strand:+ start:9588 stop:10226 length:639 start_codon:yes stop_codon:yes gene_type:complete
MSTLLVDGINDAAGGGPKATLPTSGGSAFTLGPNWGVWEFVSTAAITAVANLNVTGIAAGYDYLVQLEAFAPTTDLNTLWLRFSDDAGSTYKSGASDYAWSHQWSGSQTLDAADSEIEFGEALQWGNDAGNMSTFGFTFINPGGTEENTMVVAVGGYQNASVTPNPITVQGFGYYGAATAAIDAIQFGWATNYGTNTFKAQGDITVWRRRRS